MDHINIELPELHQSDLVACYAQVRPYRQGGIRIEREIINGKTIIHNYGHGGAGVSLAPASANDAAILGKNQIIIKNINIAIIGCGIVGLLMARQILRINQTAQITIYSQQIPVFGNKNNSQMITSEAAPGFWLPYHYGNSDKDLHQRHSDFSYAYYKRMSEMNGYAKFLKEVDVYELTDGPDRDETVVHLTSDMAPTLKQIDITLNNKTTLRARVFKSLKVDMQPFLQILINQLKGRVKFLHKKVTKQNLALFEQNLIFNCSGLGSRELFGDDKLKGKKGHLLQYRNIKPEKYNYFLRANYGNRKMLYYMHESRIIIGRTVQNEQNKIINQQVVKDIIQIHHLIRQKFNLDTISPKL